jgi:hypothetical protein
MTSWTKAITHPLGLVGFALFLVFVFIAKAKWNDERRWFSWVFVAMAGVALTGGLFLEYVHPPTPTTPAAQINTAPAQLQTNQVQQSTTGPGSPAVQGVQGDVSVTVDQSTGEAKPKKPAKKNPAEKEPDRKSQ